MDRYQRVEKPRPESEAINENEIRITSQGLIRNYVSYAASLLQERRLREIVLKAMGQAISKAVAIAEFIKIRNPHLHQDTSISSVSITDVWEPIEEGLVPLEMTRHVSMISITLSTREPNKKTPGYQAPSHVEQPKRQQNFQQVQQSQQQQQQYRPALGQLNDDSYGRGRGRSRGRGRGWTRGGYGGYNNQGGYGGYGNNRGYGGYGNNQGGYGNNQGGYGNNQGGYGNNQGGYGNNQGGYGSYSYNQGGYSGYGNNQENGGWNPNWNQGAGRGRGGWNSRGGGYGGGRGGNGGRGSGGRGYGRARGRMGGRGRGM
ncbi:TATA-binding protein-associated factor 2N-like isoform X3 [Canna indica]|uniref:TATA-binding protein-associated factor 2N-like isoform X3 n=1 Tax=Canna indica TaxID=4628 RepID=A0AAQ3Q0Q0_9LILI|nr:TATA-binding protein-associated factor 2N-like isoform X3 [Canna indica]